MYAITETSWSASEVDDENCLFDVSNRFQIKTTPI